MVTVTNFHKVEKKDGTSFISLELTGDLELIQSQTSGNFYANVSRCRIPSTFDAGIAQSMIGKQLEGDVVRVEVPMYEFLNKRTGELMQLAHSFMYRPKGSVELIGRANVEDLELV